MFLSASPQETFRAAEIAAQNATPAPKSRLLMAGMALAVLYYLLSRKG